MPEHVSVSSFLDVVQRSELVKPSDLEELRTEFESDRASDPIPEDVANLMVMDADPVVSEIASLPNGDFVTIGANGWFLTEEQQRERGVHQISQPRHVDGDIGEVFIMSRPLSATKIRRPYEARKPSVSQ